MKSYDQTIASIYQKADEAVKARAAKKQKLVRFSVILSCALLICALTVSLVVLMLKRGAHPSPVIPGTESETKAGDPIEETEILELLSFKVMEDPASELGREDDTEDYRLLSDTDMFFASAYPLEFVNSGHNTFVVTVKNTARYSFIDLVLYISWLDTEVVYNEGHGDYQCASTTVLEDGLWVTKIEFTMDIGFDDRYEAYLEIKQISFLHSENSTMDATLNGKETNSMHLALVYDSDFELNTSDLTFEIVFDGKSLYAVAKKVLKPSVSLSVPGTVSYSDHNGLHVCYVRRLDDRLFEETPFVEELVLPGFLEGLESNIFWNLNRLETIYFDGSIEEWNDFLAGYHIPSQCVTVYCLDGEATVGAHQLVKRNPAEKIEFNNAEMEAVLPSMVCTNCGKVIEESRAVKVQYLSELSDAFEDRAPQIHEPFQRLTEDILISCFRTQFEEPIDLSQTFLIVIDFSTDNMDGLRKSGKGQFELTSSGKQDSKEINWEISSKVFQSCDMTSDHSGKIVLCVTDGQQEAFGCDLTAVNYARMYLFVDAKAEITFQIDHISFFKPEL